MKINPQEIIENNKLIASFCNNKDVTINIPDFFMFHNSWSCLTPVIDKIEAIESYKCEFYSVEITRTYVTIRGTTKGIYYKIENGDKFTALWLAVVDFIKWYNEKHGITTL
jgi:hypothetical protein